MGSYPSGNEQQRKRIRWKNLNKIILEYFEWRSGQQAPPAVEATIKVICHKLPDEGGQQRATRKEIIRWGGSVCRPRRRTRTRLGTSRKQTGKSKSYLQCKLWLLLFYEVPGKETNNKNETAVFFRKTAKLILTLSSHKYIITVSVKPLIWFICNNKKPFKPHLSF